MKRFLKVLALLVVSLLLLATGVDVTLDRLAHSPSENSFAWYNTKGNVVVAYDGPAALTQNFTPPVRVTTPGFFHRT